MSGVAGQETGKTIALAAQLARVQLPSRPRLAPWIAAVELGDDRLQLRAADFAYTFRHPFLIDVYRAVGPLLDGTRTLEEIVQAGEPDVAEASVLFVLKLLQANGMLQPGWNGKGSATALAPWERQLRFLAHVLPDAGTAQAALLQARVAVAGEGALAGAVESALRSVGVAPVDADLDDTDLVIGCRDSPAFAFFDDLNAACLASGTRWLRVAVVGTTAQLGPTVVPHETACFTCFDVRSRSHENDVAGFAAYRGRAQLPDEGALAPLQAVLAAEAALEAVRILTAFAPPATIGRFFELDAGSPMRVAHDVLKVPRCPSCGSGGPPRAAWDVAVAP